MAKTDLPFFLALMTHLAEHGVTCPLPVKAGTLDLKALAAEADVDRVVIGRPLRAGAELRVSAQLVDAPSGTVLASHTVQSSLGDPRSRTTSPAASRRCRCP